MTPKNDLLILTQGMDEVQDQLKKPSYCCSHFPIPYQPITPAKKIP